MKKYTRTFEAIINSGRRIYMYRIKNGKRVGYRNINANDKFLAAVFEMLMWSSTVSWSRLESFLDDMSLADLVGGFDYTMNLGIKDKMVRSQNIRANVREWHFGQYPIFDEDDMDNWDKLKKDAHSALGHHKLKYTLTIDAWVPLVIYMSNKSGELLTEPKIWEPGQCVVDELMEVIFNNGLPFIGQGKAGGWTFADWVILHMDKSDSQRKVVASLVGEEFGESETANRRYTVDKLSNRYPELLRAEAACK